MSGAQRTRNHPLSDGISNEHCLYLLLISVFQAGALNAAPPVEKPAATNSSRDLGQSAKLDLERLTKWNLQEA